MKDIRLGSHRSEGSQSFAVTGNHDCYQQFSITIHLFTPLRDTKCHLGNMDIFYNFR